MAYCYVQQHTSAFINSYRALYVYLYIPKYCMAVGDNTANFSNPPKGGVELSRHGTSLNRPLLRVPANR